MSKFFYQLTITNWGFPYHFIRQFLILSIIFGGVGVDEKFIPFAVAITFLYGFVEMFFQIGKTKDKVGEAEDLIADLGGIFLFLYVVPQQELIILPHLAFWGLIVILSIALYMIEKYGRKGLK